MTLLTSFCLYWNENVNQCLLSPSIAHAYSLRTFLLALSQKALLFLYIYIDNKITRDPSSRGNMLWIQPRLALYLWISLTEIIPGSNRQVFRSFPINGPCVAVEKTWYCFIQFRKLKRVSCLISRFWNIWKDFFEKKRGVLRIMFSNQSSTVGILLSPSDLNWYKISMSVSTVRITFDKC